MSFNEIKIKSKESLKGKYGDAIAVLIINFLISFVVGIGLGFIAIEIDLDEKTTSLISNVITIVIMGLFQFGMLSYFLKRSRNENVTYKELFSKTNMFFSFIGLYILVSIVTFLWSLLFIIPGILAVIDYSLVYFIKLDNPNLGLSSVMKKSKELMKGNRDRYFGLCVGLFAYFVLGAFTLGILYIWILPLSCVMMANFYNDLLAKNGSMNNFGMNIPVAANASMQPMYGQQPLVQPQNGQYMAPVQPMQQPSGFCAYCGSQKNDGMFCKSCGGKY